MAAGAARIRVTYQVDADGLLSVHARENTTGAEASVVVKPSYGLADEDITRMLRESYEHAKDDMHVRALQEARVEGERLIEAVNAALGVDAELLSAEERNEISCRIDALASALPGNDHRAVKASTEALNRVTESFAARRMDRSVKRALAGRAISNLDL